MTTLQPCPIFDENTTLPLSSGAMSTMLKSLSKHHKILNSIDTKVINYLGKCYSDAVAQNKGNTEALQNNLRQIVPHTFGEHTCCGAWCKYKVTPNYKHSSLPRGQPLKDDSLRAALVDFIEVHARNSHRLSPNGSTKAN